MQRGGFDIFTGIADEFIREALLAEAVRAAESYDRKLFPNADTEENRGGAP